MLRGNARIITFDSPDVGDPHGEQLALAPALSVAMFI
jgi:hypothetical protein